MTEPCGCRAETVIAEFDDPIGARIQYCATHRAAFTARDLLPKRIEAAYRAGFTDGLTTSALGGRADEDAAWREYRRRGIPGETAPRRLSPEEIANR